MGFEVASTVRVSIAGKTTKRYRVCASVGGREVDNPHDTPSKSNPESDYDASSDDPCANVAKGTATLDEATTNYLRRTWPSTSGAWRTAEQLQRAKYSVASCLPVPSDHLLDNHPRHVDICERGEAVVEHVFAETRVTAAHHENVVVLAHVLRYPILQSGVALVYRRSDQR